VTAVELLETNVELIPTLVVAFVDVVMKEADQAGLTLANIPFIRQMGVLLPLIMREKSIE